MVCPKFWAYLSPITYLYIRVRKSILNGGLADDQARKSKYAIDTLFAGVECKAKAVSVDRNFFS